MPDVALPYTKFAAAYDKMMENVNYARWADYIDKLFSRYNFHPKNVLDVACGTGSATILLAKKGYITYLITPNYDRLFERIFAEYDVPFSLFCPTDGYYERHKDGDKRVLILKPHGTFTPKHEDVSHLITTTGQIGIRPHILTEQIIQAIVKNRSILFAGYRDKDIDLFPAFFSSLSIIII